MTSFKPYVPGQPITTQPEPAADSLPDEPDPLYDACHNATYPKTVIWPDVGRVTYHNVNELYNELWQRSMVKEALGLGGVIR